MAKVDHWKVNEVFKAAYEEIVKDMALEWAKPSPLLDLFDTDSPSAKIPVKYMSGKVQLKTKPYGLYSKKSWSCGCWDGHDTSFFCSNWAKRPNSCNRSKSGG